MSAMSEVPEFLRECADDGDELLSFREVVSSWEEAAPSRFRMAEDVLLATVEEAPLKYAPFYDRVADLLHVPLDRVEDVLSESGFKRAPFTGIRYKNCPMPVGEGIVGTVVQFDAGVRYPRHRHKQTERLLVIEGGYTDDEGKHFGPGDLHEMPSGSAHGFCIDSDGPCVAVSVGDEKLEFTSPLLRILARLIGR